MLSLPRQNVEPNLNFIFDLLYNFEYELNCKANLYYQESYLMKTSTILILSCTFSETTLTKIKF